MKNEFIIELSQKMIPDKENFKLKARTYDVTEELPKYKHRPDIWYVLGEVTMSTHVGTHIEFPFHHLEEGADAAKYPIDRLIGEAIVLNFFNKSNGEQISLEEVMAYKDRIKEGDIIFIRTDMDKLFRTNRWDEQPFLTIEAMEWLISLKPKIIGTDAAGFEVPGTDYQPNHLNMFKNNIAMVESATNLSKIGDERALVIILPLPIEGIDACPVRIIAIRKGGLANGYQ